MSHNDQIRDNLVLWLSRTQAASRELSPEQQLAFCKKVGITLELFREAQLLRVKNEYKYQQSTGRQGDYISSKITSQTGNYFTIVAHCSREMKDHISHYCETRHINTSTLARSLVHHYLRGTWEPEQVTGVWNVHDFNGDQSAVKEANIHAAITQSAKIALNLRAKAMGVSGTKLIRALISETINGNFAQPGTIRFLSKGQMFSDIKKYVVPDI